MSESSATDAAAMPTRFQRMRQRLAPLLRPALLVLAGALATFGGLWLYRLAAPPPAPLSIQDVDAIVAQAAADATPAPAYSTTVNELILPSLVFIRAGSLDDAGDGMARAQNGAVTAAVAAAWQPYQDQASVQASRPIQNNLARGIGSGVIVSSDGLILTALHVVAGAQVIELLFADGTVTTGTLVAVQFDNDIAVIQPQQLPETFAPATLGNPNALRIGDEAYVVSSPLGLAGSMSAGVISGLDRTYAPPGLPRLEGLIQFDAAVNAGSSGGPLLNRNGEVVGIVVALVNPTSANTFMGIGLAVRIDTAGGAAGAPEQ